MKTGKRAMMPPAPLPTPPSAPPYPAARVPQGTKKPPVSEGLPTRAMKGGLFPWLVQRAFEDVGYLDAPGFFRYRDNLRAPVVVERVKKPYETVPLVNRPSRPVPGESRHEVFREEGQAGVLGQVSFTGQPVRGLKVRGQTPCPVPANRAFDGRFARVFARALFRFSVSLGRPPGLFGLFLFGHLFFSLFWFSPSPVRPH